MVTVTDKAAEELKKILETENKQGQGIKIYVAGIGCSGPSYGLAIQDTPEDGEKEYVDNGIKLFLNEQVSLAIADSVFDFVETPQGSGFAITNPNASSCGSSCGSGGCH